MSTPPRAVELSATRAHAGTVLLAFATGATDAFAFAQLGGVFTANMTGSLVLSGLTTRPAYGSLISGAAVALTFFVISVYCCGRLTGPAPGRKDLLRTLGVVTVVNMLLVCAAPILTVESTYTASGRLLLLALSAAAMDGQTAVVRRYETQSGVSSTFVTGTITSLALDLADGRRPTHWKVRCGVIVALVCGALACSAVMTGMTPTWAPVIACIATALTIAIFAVPARHDADISTD